MLLQIWYTKILSTDSLYMHIFVGRYLLLLTKKANGKTTERQCHRDQIISHDATQATVRRELRDQLLRTNN